MHMLKLTIRNLETILKMENHVSVILNIDEEHYEQSYRPCEVISYDLEKLISVQRTFKNNGATTLLKGNNEWQELPVRFRHWLYTFAAFAVSGREWDFAWTSWAEWNWCGWSYAVDSTRTTIPWLSTCTYTWWVAKCAWNTWKWANRVIGNHGS